ncbi:tegument protein UL14 [Common bottlenose dolphin gammaherpesvirus 1 strain Sarasota]|uniref:Tegument protein UL14 n=1 Tax=Common bottlenose dolphin gammaherpesvirus 1 strain Sarasota TaxID=2022783 RepID=A0A1Z1NEA3_9GAMA|nr:tegument protein UL14 [Common bottlenose dolphin gammaherpesvirus 1 strain Sarasota]ARW78098.1 tegument protein UL14 [Common bottlenose dolphin gammaherpesvirus 1 strain Sarasota]
MDYSKNSKRELIRRALEAGVNKSASVAIYSQFGRDHCIFRTQYKTTQDTIARLHNLERAQRLSGKGTLLEASIAEYQSRLRQIRTFDPARVKVLEDLKDQVAELEDELHAELDTLERDAETSAVEVSDECDRRHDRVEADIFQWRIQAAPRVCGLPPPPMHGD